MLCANERALQPHASSSLGTLTWRNFVPWCIEEEFKRFFVELITALIFLQNEDHRSVYGARFGGQNVSSSGDETWVLSPTAQIHPRQKLD